MCTGARVVLVSVLALVLLSPMASVAEPTPRYTLEASQQQLLVDCRFGPGASFAGVKDPRTGRISGTWTFTAVTECERSMLRLSVRARLLRETLEASRTPRGACALGIGNPCREVRASQGFACSPCNGTWRVRSTHVLEYPGLGVLAAGSPGCASRGLNAVQCTVTSQPLILT